MIRFFLIGSAVQQQCLYGTQSFVQKVKYNYEPRFYFWLCLYSRIQRATNISWVSDFFLIYILCNVYIHYIDVLFILGTDASFGFLEQGLLYFLGTEALYTSLEQGLVILPWNRGSLYFLGTEALYTSLERRLAILFWKSMHSWNSRNMHS